MPSSLVEKSAKKFSTYHMNTQPEPYKNQSKIKNTAKYMAAAFLVLLFSLWCSLADFALIFDLFCQFRYQLTLSALLLLLPLSNRKVRSALNKKQQLIVWLSCLLSLGLNILFIFSGKNIERAASATKTPHTLTIAQCNINSANYNPIKMLKSCQSADIICLEEISPKLAEELNNKDGLVSKAYPYKIIKPRLDNFGIGILSKLPIKSSRIFQNEESIPSIECLISLGSKEITVRAIHTLPPLSENMYKSRNRDFKNLAVCGQTTTPLIVAGDFNCVPWSPHMKPIFASGLKKACPAYALPPPTWCTMLPLPMRLPIDHIFISKDFAVSSLEIGADTGSDHLPLIAKLHLQDSN